MFASGHTLVLQALHRFWPPIVAFAGTLGAELGHPVQVNAYITPKQAQGFAAHYDVHDVFVLQIAGAKRWVVHEPVHRDPLRSQPWTLHRAAVEERASEIPRDEYTLVAGDVLYLPRGFVHSAESLGDVSAHLTIGIHSHSRSDLVQSLLELAADDARLRQTLPLGVDVGEPDHLAADLAATVEALCERIRSIPARDVAEVMERRSRAHSRPAPIAPLAQAGALHGLDRSTLVSVRPQQSPTVWVNGASATVRYVGGSLVFSSAANEALVAVLESSDGIRVGDIPGQSIEESLDLVRRLMRAGVVIADEPIIQTET
ncbi:MAG: cupin domain-containing protein [Thermoleophilia bacterium]|nr:cupin domain-containing protein [Thermoleophilia bacterium]